MAVATTEEMQQQMNPREEIKVQCLQKKKRLQVSRSLLSDKLSSNISYKKKKPTIFHQSQLRESSQLAHIDEMSSDTQKVLYVK